MQRLKRILLLLFVSLLPPVMAASQSLDDSRKTLEQIQGRIQSTTRALEEKQAGARSLAADVKAMEADLARLNRQINDLERRDRELQEQIKVQERESAAARGRVEEVRLQVERRLVALYKEGESGPMSILFGSRTPARMAEEYDYMARVLSHDRELLEDFRLRVAQAEAARRKLETMQAEQRAVLAGVTDSRVAAQQAAALKGRLLSRVKQEEKALSHQLGELRDQAAELAQLVKKLESEQARRYTGDGVFANLKGRLPWPLKGPVVLGFGPQIHPELGTQFDSQGIHIGVSDVRPVHAVADGRVVFANWFKGYGNLLILDHGDSYYTLYAQNARLLKGVGDAVKRGEAVGYSGLPGTNGIYFELRQGGTPQNPSSWLGPP
ncbi:Septal ring factor EnvC, activator of murein hydrolases AmiA and AmiB [Geoalkalibacter ferrihydriticus]|uniref:Septal ring factor EnvC, activator of murein hydrolases AmiA and AmiB n=1 Tax=Geoalkalibacter ferrihydriticus TaxID=392333 RepID=A0A1G9PAP5_9BACT|nr:peptidoglycan DD-metalloendopeptidase family protein [Geoalkalibacter ferrihydriticus]SDL95876.1 Septal ring factor EnvC, activator of murein hydrolases AmiA and AmiB [Geoalkalibacter ferrihydriticus]